MSPSQFSMRVLLVAALVAGVFVASAIRRTPRHGLAADPPTGQHSLWADQPSTEQPCTQFVFTGPEGMNITWDVTVPGAFDSEPLVVPDRYNFPRCAIYRLKLSNIPGREGVEIYPLLEVGPAVPLTKDYLERNAVPVHFTEADFDDILAGRSIMNVIYLPDERDTFGGVAVVVKRMLGPGEDPCVEADRRGAILAIVSVGNIARHWETWGRDLVKAADLRDAHR
jgi:hypothetical protein